MKLSHLFVGGAIVSVLGIIVLMIVRPDGDAMTALTVLAIGFGVGSLVADYVASA